MQNKGFIKGIAILFALACLFHLSFTFVTARVEKKARAFAYGQETEMEASALAGDDLTKYQFLYDLFPDQKKFIIWIRCQIRLFTISLLENTPIKR